MIQNIVPIIVIFTAIIITSSASYDVISKSTECSPNEVYKKDDVTCICNVKGQWPHRNCSLIFNRNRPTACEPDGYVNVGCNVCRCTKTGYIDEEFCTKHICDEEPQNAIQRNSRRANDKCKPNHWYTFSKCRVCYCVDENNILCNSGINNANSITLGKNHLTDCGTNFLNKISKLLSKENHLRDRSIKSNKVKSETAKIDSDQVGKSSIEPKSEEMKNNLFSFIFNNKNTNGHEVSSFEHNDEKVDENNLSSSTENNSEPDNEKNITKSVLRIAANTAIPFGNDEDNLSDDSNESQNYIKEDSNNESSDNEKLSEGIDSTFDAVTVPTVRNNKNIKNNEKLRKILKTDPHKKVIQVNIPEVLGTVFNFGRRSLVTLDNANCLPGSTVVVNCNTCFCMKNGKMLCTKKICG